jgi:hypothetical protein
MKTHRYQKIPEILEQVPAVLTVLVAALAMAISQIWAFNTNTLILLVLTVVALLATSELIARYRQIRRIDKNTQRMHDLIETQVGGQLSAEVFFCRKAPSFDTLIRDATDIRLLGANLMGITSEFRRVLIDRLRAGASVKLIILNPASSAVEAASYRNGDRNIEAWHLRFGTTRFNLDFMKKTLGGQQKLQVHVIPYPPTFQLWMFDVETPEGTIVVEIYPHQATDMAYTPVFVLKANRDRTWYEYFRRQFDVTWANSEEWF